MKYFYRYGIPYLYYFQIVLKIARIRIRNTVFDGSYQTLNCKAGLCYVKETKEERDEADGHREVSRPVGEDSGL